MLVLVFEQKGIVLYGTLQSVLDDRGQWLIQSEDSAGETHKDNGEMLRRNDFNCSFSLNQID